ncbi:DEAD/DEAH box helicase [Turicimonas muris]|uniref:DEAD/DEAH box helicase n=2 Tax=Turicimonas muris TaxID=1796652 RepID=UPI0026F0572C|nr:DEAD/DEAH box helicase family protein [Turicimonas muris]
MFELKKYQQTAIDTLAEFLSVHQQKGAQEAYRKLCVLNGWGQQSEYCDLFNGAPAVCLRVPTGGGKTIIAASSIKTIDQGTLDTGAPVVLWLTPSDAITTQTVSALNSPSHPYRKSLEKQYPGKVKVCDIDSVQSLAPSDFRQYCIVIVSTNQTFNIRDTGKRNAYSFNENLESFFLDLSAEQTESLEKVTKQEIEEYPNGVLTRQDEGRVKYSLANLLKLYRPILIVDEAHNNRTETYFNTLNRLNPSASLELTATPQKMNNTIFTVSAWDLKAENMIKLPILLTGEELGWEHCLIQSIEKLKELDKLSITENKYIRPILLIQAEKKEGTATVDMIKKYMTANLNILEKEIAVYTGETKDFSGNELFSPNCPIRYVITIKALAEGWDCSFAYVLCGLQNIKNAKDTEQLLGRILRMPYAEKRVHPELNKAYANIQSSATMKLALTLKEGFVRNMGFDRQDASDLIQLSVKPDIETCPDQPSLFELGDDRKDSDNAKKRTPVAQIAVTLGNKDLTSLIEEKEIKDIQVSELNPDESKKERTWIITTPTLNEEENRKLIDIILSNTPKKLLDTNKEKIDDLYYQQNKERCKSIQKEPIKPIPLLLLKDPEGEDRIFSCEVLNSQEWEPSKYGYELKGFTPVKELKGYLFDSKENGKFQLNEIRSSISQKTPVFNSEFELITKEQLIYWLSREVKRNDLTPQTVRKFVEAIVTRDLLTSKGYSLESLYQSRVPLAKAIKNLLESNFKLSKSANYQWALPLTFMEPAKEEFCFKFDPQKYTPRNCYVVEQGSRQFEKHYFPKIHDLHYKTPSGNAVSEEYLCAVAIDMNPKVEFWIRIIEKSDDSFRLETPFGFFYPDFYVQLEDGRRFIVEYKGEQLWSNTDSQLKRDIGKQWEKASNGECLFLMCRYEDKGLDISEQINNKIDGIR